MALLAKSYLHFLLKSIPNSSDSLLQQVTIQKLAFISTNFSKDKILNNWTNYYCDICETQIIQSVAFYSR